MSHWLLLADKQLFKTNPLQTLKKMCRIVLNNNSVKASLVLVLFSAALLSPLTLAGGLKSVLKEVSRAEKKLKDEGLLSDNEDLYFSFKNGVEIHDMWSDGAKVHKVNKYYILIKDENSKRWADLSEKDTKKMLMESTKKLAPYINFYKSKPFKLEQMYASGSCFQRQNVEAFEVMKTYSEILMSSLESSDIYDARATALESLAHKGVTSLSLSALKFSPEDDMTEFESLRKSLAEKRPAVRKRIGKNRSLLKCYKLFKM